MLPSPSVRLPKLKTLLLAPLVLFALKWLGLAMYLAMLGDELPAPAAQPSPPKTGAIFGAG